MNNQIIRLSIIILSSILLLSSLALAGGKDKAKNKTKPPGWEHGEKTGWKGENTPPGLTEDKLEKKHTGGMYGQETKAKAQKEGNQATPETELEAELSKHEAEIVQE